MIELIKAALSIAHPAVCRQRAEHLDGRGGIAVTARMREAAVRQMVTEHRLHHGGAVLAESAVVLRIDPQIRQRHDHLRGALAVLGAHRLEAAAVKLSLRQPTDRAIHSGSHIASAAVMGRERLQGHRGHIHVAP